MSEVLRHVVESIAPASRAHGEAVRAKVAAANATVLERLAAILGGAQHTASPRVERRTIVVCTGDHGAGDPGIALGASHPTVIAATAIADGSAALCNVARASRVPIVLVDAGAVEGAAMPASTIEIGHGPSRDVLREPAMPRAEAVAGLEAGIALAISLSESGLDLLALGSLGVGSEIAASAILGAHENRGPSPISLAVSPAAENRGPSPISPAPISVEGLVSVDRFGTDAAMREAARLGRAWSGDDPIELLARFGGPETCVLAGLILGAASLHVPVILDGHATGAAAVVATRFAPAAAGYLVAAHAGSPLHAQLLAVIGLEPLFAVGLGHGEGIGAAMVFPWIDQVAALAGPR